MKRVGSVLDSIPKGESASGPEKPYSAALEHLDVMVLDVMSLKYDGISRFGDLLQV